MFRALQTFRSQTILLLALSLLLPASVAAQSNDWWFEIEVILFKRKVDPEQLVETFRQDQSSLKINSAIDLISPYIRPDITAYRDSLPYCPGEFKPEIIRPYPLFWATFAELKLDPVAADDMLTPESASVEQGNEVYGEFETNNSNELTEQDPDSITPGELFTVEQSFLIPVQAQNEDQLAAWQTPSTLACVYPQEQQLLLNPLLESWIHPEFIANVPAHINGVERLHANSPYLLAGDSLALNYLYKEIKRQRDLTPLLHMGWRQEVKFGRGKADTFRLFAGHNYADEYSASGERLRSNVDDETQQPSTALAISETDQDEQAKLYASIDVALQDTSPVSFALSEPTAAIVYSKEQNKLEQLWELDGLFKVYLQYINKVPYLHIESDLDYRAPVHVTQQAASKQNTALQDELQFHLQSYRLNQLRRVISKEVHYFDHPLFGAIVQIRRHERPEPLEPLEPEIEQQAAGQAQ
jgi:hypothetical protein